ncbi:MAG: hypothetical protein VX938_00110, partial [Myxococcota bacterium]|nr:hypothetical protein [Myxococcota bacterium]
MKKIPHEVLEEEQLLETVKANIVRLRARARGIDHDKALTELRDSLDGEKLPEDIASIMESMERMAALRAQQARSTEGEVDPANPYFGHMVVEDDHGKRSILIGRQT